MTLLSIQEATNWAKDYLKREISKTNISYLVQYGKVKKYEQGGSTYINLNDLKDYYDTFSIDRQSVWKDKLGSDLNWSLSFENLREKDTTKHVHRLHPYKGKFIPQLVEYFLDGHTDSFKREVYFKKGDIILDPFLGSGTTLVQANELGIHGVGVDISIFNCTISKCKIQDYNYADLAAAIKNIKEEIKKFEADARIVLFEEELASELSKFNKKYFPSPDFKYRVNAGEVKEKDFAKDKEKKFLPLYKKLLLKYKIKPQDSSGAGFIDKWYMGSIKKEISFIHNLIQKETNKSTKELLLIILSRTVRSSRATTHSDLATLKEPQLNTYYCFKHRKICKPMFSMMSMFNKYSEDTLKRVKEFSGLKKNAEHLIIDEDSRIVDIDKHAREKNKKFAPLLKKKKIDGIFSSPPYVGQIDYHEQHSYAYDLFKLPRKDESEIGPLFRGQGSKAKESYVQGIADVLNNCKKFMKKDFDIFLVANDKHNLYPSIAERAGMKIVNQFKRPVLNRTERDRNPYSEIIFHLKSSR